MKIAITGAYGFLGTHLTEYYKNKGDVVIKIGRNDNKSSNILGCDLLIHAAGINRAATPEDVFNGNINIAKELILGLESLNIQIPIKYISSISETDNSAYGNSKRKVKSLLQKYSYLNKTLFESYNLPNLFGTKGKPNYNSFVNTFAYNIVNNIECKYNTNPISLCHVTDAIKVIDNQTKEYKLYHTTVEEVYLKLNNIGSSELDKKLNEILNYYKL